MSRRILRRIALALIAVVAFAQANVALAACPMERGAMAQAAADGGCCDTPQLEPAPQLTNGCVAHCTADLQLSAVPVALVRPPADVPVLFVPGAQPDLPTGAGLATPPLLAPPSRILLHSFLV
jgi:hypothetical protein